MTYWIFWFYIQQAFYSKCIMQNTSFNSTVGRHTNSMYIDQLIYLLRDIIIVIRNRRVERLFSLDAVLPILVPPSGSRGVVAVGGTGPLMVGRYVFEVSGIWFIVVAIIPTRILVWMSTSASIKRASFQKLSKRKQRGVQFYKQFLTESLGRSSFAVVFDQSHNPPWGVK